MGVLAFLQCAYASSEESALRWEAKREAVPVEEWRRLYRWLLFQGGFTGQRIQKIFGKDLCDLIAFDNASPRVGWEPGAKFPADLEHMRAQLRHEGPTTVIGFGKVACDALALLQREPDLTPVPFIVIACPHPAARQPDVTKRLHDARLKVCDVECVETCPHCNKLTWGGSHCQQCFKSMSWDEP